MASDINAEHDPTDSTLPSDSEDGDDEPTVPPKKISVINRLWKKLDLDLETAKMMAKGALPPAIAAAVFQASSVAKTFTTLGYLVSIMAFFSFAIQPRARFVQTMVLNIIGVCTLAATTLLAIYCAVKARELTERSSSTAVKVIDVPYNSSASAVIGVWLCISIYIINILRAARPQLSVTGTILSFFVLVACVNATRIPHMKQAELLIKRMVAAFLTGFAIAVGVSFVIFPRSSRQNCFKLTGEFVRDLKESLKAQGLYIRRMRRKNILFTCVQDTRASTAGKTAEEIRSSCSPEAARLKATTATLTATFGRMHTELEFAQQEFAYGHLDAYDIKKLYSMLQSILLPMNGMCTLVDILKEVAIRVMEYGDDEDTGSLSFDEILAEREAWRDVMDTLLTSYDKLSDALQDSLDHIYMRLRFKRKRKTAEPDTESGKPTPGDKNFAGYLTKMIEEFDESRTRTLRAWSNATGVELPVVFFPDPGEGAPSSPKTSAESDKGHRKNQQRLYLILYIEFLTWSIGRGILDLVVFADCKYEEATLRGSRLILPGKKRIKKLIKSILDSNSDLTADPTISGSQTTRTMVHLGDAFNIRKDPEHLPPTNYWERTGDRIRRVAHFLASPESGFGLRAVCAVMTIAIIVFLKDTQTWFLQQRGLWAVILVSISMAPTTGASILGFLGRVIGTILAMCTSITLWYIPDGRTGGVIPLLWFFEFIGFYFILKYPQWSIGALLFNVTQLLIIGYELEVSKLGSKLVESNGQLFYPIYLLAPYRLATVVTGTFVAFVWSYIPFPMTTHGKLRIELGAGLHLLAKYYATVHATVEMRLLEEIYDPRVKGSPARKVEHARSKIFAKTGLQMGKLHGLAREWEPTMGGKFPKKTYDQIITSMQTIYNYMTLISYSTRTFSPGSPLYSVSSANLTSTSDATLWVHSFRSFMRSLTITSHDITSMLSLLSASVTNGQPLPPFLKIPSPYRLGVNLHIVDPDLLGIEHVAEPCYSAFAVCQVASSLVSDELERLVGLVKSLVGEVDFSFHVIKGDNNGENGRMKGKGKAE